jgi:hypothetical protein
LNIEFCTKIILRNAVLPKGLKPNSLRDAKAFENAQKPKTTYFG